MGFCLFNNIAVGARYAQKVGYKFWQDRDQEDLFIENINPTRLFFNTDVADVRLLDINLIGEIRDTDLDNIVSAFAQNEAEAEIIRGWYQNKDRINTTVQYDGLSPDRIDGLDASVTGNKFNDTLIYFSFGAIIDLELFTRRQF